MDEWDNVRLMLGIHPEQFSWTLQQDAVFEAPECILTFTDEGLNGLGQESAAFIEKHVIAPYWQNGRGRLSSIIGKQLILILTKRN